MISSACLLPLTRALPDARVYLILQPAMLPLFHDHPLLSGVVTWEGKGGEEALAERLRGIDAYAVVHFNEHPGVESAAMAAGIPQRIGWSRGQRACLTEVVPDARKRGGRHEVQFCWELLSRLGLPPLERDPEPCLSPDPRARGRLEELGLSRPYLAVHLAAHGGKPRVPLSYFAAAIQPWTALGGLDVVVIGGEPEPGLAAGLSSRLDTGFRIHDLTGRLSLATSAWLLKEAAFFVSRDSGPAHLAAAMACPTLAFFPEPSPWASAVRWRPLGPNVWTYEKPVKRRWWDTQRTFVRRSLKAFEACEIAALGREAMNVAVAHLEAARLSRARVRSDGRAARAPRSDPRP